MSSVSESSYFVRDAANYNVSFPNFREPKQIGHFSVGDKREYYDDYRELKYLRLPENSLGVSFDLNAGYEGMIRKDPSRNEKLDNLLTWVVRNQRKFALQSCASKAHDVKSLNTDFICYRGLLTLLLCTPYEKQDDWEICATKYYGTIYLYAFPTEQKKIREENQTEKDRRMCAWGRKFEQYVVTDKKDGQPDLKSPVNENREYCIIVRSRLNNHSLVYGAEVDCIELNSDPNTNSCQNYVELKTSRHMSTSRQYQNFCRFKLIKWWAQSFLIGIPKIICGFRDDNGFVNELQTILVADIPKQAGDCWSASSCFNFCQEFLSFAKQCVKEDNPYTVYQFYWTPRERIVCRKLPCPGDRQILPAWYIDELNKRELSA